MVPHPPRDSPDGPAERAEALITALLSELEPAATLLEFTPALLNHYRFAIAVPGEIGKTVIVSTRLVDHAMTNFEACRALRAYLRAELARQRSQQARDRVSEIRAALSTRLCPVCERPILTGQPVVARGVEMRHAQCGRADDAA